MAKGEALQGSGGGAHSFLPPSPPPMPSFHSSLTHLSGIRCHRRAWNLLGPDKSSSLASWLHGQCCSLSPTQGSSCLGNVHVPPPASEVPGAPGSVGKHPKIGPQDRPSTTTCPFHPPPGHCGEGHGCLSGPHGSGWWGREGGKGESVRVDKLPQSYSRRRGSAVTGTPSSSFSRGKP